MDLNSSQQATQLKPPNINSVSCEIVVKWKTFVNGLSNHPICHQHITVHHQEVDIWLAAPVDDLCPVELRLLPSIRHHRGAKLSPAEADEHVGIHLAGPILSEANSNEFKRSEFPKKQNILYLAPAVQVSKMVAFGDLKVASGDLLEGPAIKDLLILGEHLANSKEFEQALCSLQRHCCRLVKLSPTSFRVCALGSWMLSACLDQDQFRALAQAEGPPQNDQWNIPQRPVDDSLFCFDDHLTHTQTFLARTNPYQN